MGSWVLKSFRLDPWSYNALLRKTIWLKRKNEQEGKVHKVTPSSTLRFILRRLRVEDGAGLSKPPPSDKPSPSPAQARVAGTLKRLEQARKDADLQAKAQR